MSEFYDEYTDDELTIDFENKLHIMEEKTKKINTIIEEERQNIMLKKNINNEAKKLFKQQIEGKSIKGTSIETEKTCVFSNITKL